MGYFHGFRCCKSPKIKDEDIKRGCCGIKCSCIGETSSSSLSRVDSVGKSCGCCFPCKNTSKKSAKSRRDGKGNGCEVGCLYCFNSSSKGPSPESIEGTNKKCCSCFRPSKKGKEKKIRDCGTDYLCCKDSSPKNDESAKNRGCCSFNCNKASKKMECREDGKVNKCLCCFKSSEEKGKEKNKISCCSAPQNLSKAAMEFTGEKNRIEESRNNAINGTVNPNLRTEDSSKKEGMICCCFPRRVSKPSKEKSSKKGKIVNWLWFLRCKGKSPKESSHEREMKKSDDESTKKSERKVMCCCGFCCTNSLAERKSESKTKCSLSCFCCIQSESYQNSSFKERKIALNSCQTEEQPKVGNHLVALTPASSFESNNDGESIPQAREISPLANSNCSVQVFTHKDIAAATKNFSEDCFIGSGGFGRVYKGGLLGRNEVVAIKQLKNNPDQEGNELLVDVVMLSFLNHPNLVNLLGYCDEGDQLVLVYEHMPLGSLQDHLFDIAPNNKPLDWFTRMKIAAGAARGLQHLHEAANPPIIYRDMKASNILLDENYNPKLSDFGLEKPIRVIGSYGCCAPEYAFTRQLTKTTDVFGFGVLLLELITGRKAIDITRPKNELYLSHWAAPLFKDKRKLPLMADPFLSGNYPIKGLYQALAIANMCLQQEASSRPLIGDVVTAIEHLVNPEPDLPEPLDNFPSSSQNIPSNHEKLRMLPIPSTIRTRTSITSFDEESFQSLSSNTESCDALREEDDQIEA